MKKSCGQCIMVMLFLLPLCIANLSPFDGAIAQAEEVTNEQNSPGRVVPQDSSINLEKLFKDAMDLSRQGESSQALVMSKEGLEIAKSSGDRKMAGMFLSCFCFTYWRMSQYEKALESCEEAVVIHRAYGNVWEGHTLNLIGVVYQELGEYEKGLSYLAEAIKIHSMTDQKGERGNGMGSDLLFMGQIYCKLKRYKEALDSYQDAVHILRETQNSPDVSDRGKRNAQAREAVALAYMGNLHSEQGQFDKALQCYQAALVINRSLNQKWNMALTLVSLGHAYLALGDYQKALDLSTEGLQASIETGAPDRIWIAHYGLARVKVAQGDEPAAVTHYEKALDTIELIRSGISEKSTQIVFMKDKLFVYDEFIQFLSALHRKEPSLGYDRKSLEIFERKQGRVFLEQMGKSGVRHFTGVPDEITSKDAEFEEKLGQLRSALGDEVGKAPEKDQSSKKQLTWEQIQRVEDDYKAFQKEVQARYPDYYALKYPRPATLSEIQKVLKPREVVLVYEVMKEATCLWLISRKSLEMFTIEVGEEELQKKVNAFKEVLLKMGNSVRKMQPKFVLKQLVESSLPEIREKGENLHRLLLPDAAARGIAASTVVYVVPTGPLYNLPFEALTCRKNGKVQRPGFLVENHAIVYTSSASLLKLLRDSKAKKNTNAKNPVIAFANPVYKMAETPGASQDTAGPASLLALRDTAYQNLLGGSLPELPETEREAREIKRVLNAPDQSHPLQLRGAASRSNVFRLNNENKLESYRFVVFACHGILPDETDRVRQPALLLSHPDPETGEEGSLTMADVFGLKLNAHLVTLSACNTGKGEIHEGEGIVGLTRAFMYAGTPAICVNLWAIESGSAVVLSTGLHASLKRGKGPAEALRNVKLQMIRGERGAFYTHPFFWAPLVVFGDG